MTDISTRPAWADPSRWVWPVLMGSLALNLVVAGSMLGQRLHPQQTALPPGIATRLAQGAAAPLLQELSPEKRLELRGIFEKHRGQNKGLWTTVRDRRADVAKALQAETFDKAGYVAAMTALIEAEGKARTAAQPTFAEVAAALSTKERRDFLATHQQLRRQLMAPARENGQSKSGERKGQLPGNSDPSAGK